ncbi:hypothetical protein Cni_G18006 [Canna indica]|uniref:DUF4378 domain-containing protein n=1 Tax=Canna indica TaxID=4628 RepID=A0AAQ3QHA6_9LILI|nr:hypothetical protein Cni_G18006 [Canna indica]
MDGAWFHPQQSFQSSGWRPRKKAYRVGGGASSRSIAAPSLKLGYEHLIEQRNNLNVESDSTSSNGYQREESFQSSNKHTSGVLVSMQMDESISTVEKLGHSSPSVIEKLMGLDDLHSPGLISKQQMAVHSRGSTNAKGNTRPINKAFPRNKFVNDIDESLHITEESRSSLGEQVKKDHLVKVYKEPKHLLTKDVNWLKSPRHGRCIVTKFKSLGTKYETSEIHHKYERMTEKKGSINSVSRTSCVFSHGHKENINFSFVRLPYAGKNNPSTHPSQVVSLKQNLKMDDKMGSSILFPKQSQNFQLSNRIEATRCRFLQYLEKERDQRSLSNNVKDVAKTRRSREITRTVKKVKKQSFIVDNKRGLGHIRYSKCEVGDGHFYPFKDTVPSGDKDYFHGGKFSKSGSMHDRKNLQSLKFDREEDKLPPKEMLVSEEDLCKESYGKPSEVNLPHFPVAAVADSSSLDDMFFVSNCMDTDTILINKNLAEEVTTYAVSTQNEDISYNYQKETSFDHLFSYFPTLVDRTKGQPLSSPNIEQDVLLSPIYVDEFPSMEDSSELCFRALVAKPNSEDTCEDYLEALNIPNANNDSLQPLQQNKDVKDCRDEEAREISYLLDILSEYGNLGAKKRKLFDASHIFECGIGTGVFEKLEKKYAKFASWSSSERKLLFDLVNSTLFENLAPCIYLQPWVNSTRKLEPMLCSEGIAKRAWQILNKKLKELHVGNAERKVLDLKWLDLGDDLYEIGRMLQEELLEELVSEFISGT